MRPGATRTSTVRTLSIPGLGEFKLQRTVGRNNFAPFRQYEHLEWLGTTPSGAYSSLDCVAAPDEDPEPYVIERMLAVLAALPDLRRQAAELSYEGANNWRRQATPPGKQPRLVTAEYFAETLSLHGICYLRDEKPSGDIIVINFLDGENIFGGHSIECHVSPDLRITQTDVVG